jgi:hypothetical protein
VVTDCTEKNGSKRENRDLVKGVATVYDVKLMVHTQNYNRKKFVGKIIENAVVFFISERHFKLKLHMSRDHLYAFSIFTCSFSI